MQNNKTKIEEANHYHNVVRNTKKLNVNGVFSKEKKQNTKNQINFVNEVVLPETTMSALM